MKNILCFGDSITWGFNPENWTRFEYSQSWPGVLQNELGSDYRVVTEALNGRTTCWDLPYLPYRNGKEFLPMLLESHSPLDLVIIMLGTNDMIVTLNRTADESAWGILSLIEIILKSNSGTGNKNPKILIISPPVIGKMSKFMDMSYEGKEEESKKLADSYKIIADTTGSAFINSADFIKAADPDGIHPDAESQRILGLEVAKKVKEINI